MSDFEAIIGLEVHAQIAVQSKMFCPCSSDVFGKEPNSNTCPVCMGFPGQLPVINREAIKKGLVAALALHCEIPEFSKFDRKNYFYPDLPKGFQISQYDHPISRDGWLEIEEHGQKKRIHIARLHLEDDAGKLTHVSDGTLCDYNRSGIALMEIVSKPDMRSAEEAVAYAKSLQTILRYVQASDADMEKGMMRFDASVSIRPKGETKLYPRSEIKNLNSFRSLEAAINYEIKRQIMQWQDGKPLNSEVTVGWKEEEQKTYFLRDKEGAEDYRYFTEPDLPSLSFQPDFIDELKKEVPELPQQKIERYQREWQLNPQEAFLLSSDLKLAQYFEEVTAVSGDAQKAASFITSVLMGRLHKDDVRLENTKASAALLGKLLKLVHEGKVSMNIAKTEIFEELYQDGKDPEAIIKEKKLVQIDNEELLELLCMEAMEANPKSVEDFKNGKQQALQFLVGQVMKKTRGQAQAEKVQEIMKIKLTS